MDQYRELPDFLTLHYKDALDSAPATAVFTWNIPDSYYSPDRASTCYVTCVNCFMDNNTDATVFHGLQYSNGAANYASTQNNGILLGGVTMQATDAYEWQGSSSALQPMISSKPNTITLSITNPDGTIAGWTAGGWLIATLRFDYINPREQVGGMLSTFQPNLL